jgi:hypothetical protein
MAIASTAKPALTNLNPNDLISLSFDKRQAFKRAKKIFQISYVGNLNMNFNLHKNFS